MNQIIEIAQNVEDFEEINRDNIEEMMLNNDQELTLEELEKIITTTNELRQSKQDEEEEEPMKPEFSFKTINEIFLLANQLTERILETNPLT